MNNMTNPVPNFQDGYLVREKGKRTRFYLDNEFLKLGYAAAVRHLLPVYGVMCKYAHAETQKCWPALDTIMKEGGVSNRRTVLGVINALEYFRMIGTKYDKDLNRNTYYILTQSRWRELTSGTRATAQAVAKMPRKEYQNSTRGGGIAATLSHSIKSPNKISSNGQSGMKMLKDVPWEPPKGRGENK